MLLELSNIYKKNNNSNNRISINIDDKPTNNKNVKKCLSVNKMS